MASRPFVEKACFGLAGLGALIPLGVMWPAVEERLASQTLRWAPRWEANVNRFVRPAEFAAIRSDNPAGRVARRFEATLPLEKTVKRIDRRLKIEFERWWNIKPAQ